MITQIREDIRSPYYQEKYSNDGQRFVAWYLRNIHLRDMNEAKDDITDGSDDKQIDAIYIDDEKNTVYVIQGKFIGGNSVDGDPLREVLSSWIQLKNLVRLQEVGNNKLKRKLDEVSRALEDDYEINFELITTGMLTTAAQNDLATYQERFAELSDTDDIVCSISVVDKEELKRRYDLALEKENPSINHTIDLSNGHFMYETLANTQVVIGALPLKECIKMAGIKDGTLFQKNVRQSLGLSNAVNKGIKNTIYGDKHKDFFFFHNGITAICNKMEKVDDKLKLHGLSVVNGCQSLNTILSCSEKVKELEDTYVLFRFYEIPQRDRADRISINTNSQSAVKPRDLRSNHKRVLNLKKQFEQKYPQGYFVTKRGEIPPADKEKTYTVDLSDIGKLLIAWYSKRPNISYSETKIFDKYFDQLFIKHDCKAENAYALNVYFQEIMKVWSKENPIGFNESLLAMRAYAPYHHIYAISTCFAIANNQSENVPSPIRCLERLQQAGLLNEIIQISGICLNIALETAANEAQAQAQNKVFSPQNWVKAKSCLTAINAAIRNYFSMLPMMQGGQEIKKKLDSTLKLSSEDFEYRWAAD
jgi:hypothetical protein